MNVVELTNAIDAEISRLQRVRTLLSGTKGISKTKIPVLEGKKPRKKRVLSPETKKRIAEAQKKRWAQFRKEAA
jgi:hypothetical protein